MKFVICIILISLLYYFVLFIFVFNGRLSFLFFKKNRKINLVPQSQKEMDESSVVGKTLSEFIPEQKYVQFEESVEIKPFKSIDLEVETSDEIEDVIEEPVVEKSYPILEDEHDYETGIEDPFVQRGFIIDDINESLDVAMNHYHKSDEQKAKAFRVIQDILSVEGFDFKESEKQAFILFGKALENVGLPKEPIKKAFDLRMFIPDDDLADIERQEET